MAHYRQVLTGVAVAVAALAVAAGASNARPALTQERAEGLPKLSPEWRAGDVVFRRGTGPEAVAVQSVDNSGYTHVGLLVGRYPDWNVLHVEPAQAGYGGKVEIIPLHKFASRDHAVTYAVFRVKDAGTEAVTQALNKAQGQIGTTFDGDYRYSDDVAVYCTELVGKAYQAANIDLTDWSSAVKAPFMEDPILTPAALLKSGKLHRIG